MVQMQRCLHCGESKPGDLLQSLQRAKQRNVGVVVVLCRYTTDLCQVKGQNEHVGLQNTALKPEILSLSTITRFFRK